MQAILLKFKTSNLSTYIFEFKSFLAFWKENRLEITSNKSCMTSNDYSGSHPKFGLAVISPVLVSTIFAFIHWWKTEANLVTLPLVICQCWPQYRIIKILFFGLVKRNIRWFTEFEHHEKNVISLGKYTYTI